MARNLTYNQPGVAVVVDGVVGSGFAEEFAFNVELPDDLSELTVGLDGSSTSIASNKTCTLKVSYRLDSAMNDQFFQLYSNQQAGQGREFDISCNTGVNEKLHFSKCSIKGIEGIEGGGKVQVPRIVTLTCKEFVPDQSLFPG